MRNSGTQKIGVTLKLKAILFDLDGTLLDIDIDNFVSRYFSKLSDVIEGLGQDEHANQKVLSAIHRATSIMMKSSDGKTNKEVFTRAFNEYSGIDLDDIWPVFEQFYAHDFSQLADGAGPVAGASEALAVAREYDLKLAIATNPIFPLSAVLRRMEWADICPSRVDVITSFENMTTCKPHPNYYRQTAEMLGILPKDCLMVGDDDRLDLPAANVGMSTYYVGPPTKFRPDYKGSLKDLVGLINQLH